MLSLVSPLKEMLTCQPRWSRAQAKTRGASIGPGGVSIYGGSGSLSEQDRQKKAELAASRMSGAGVGSGGGAGGGRGDGSGSGGGGGGDDRGSAGMLAKTSSLM